MSVSPPRPKGPPLNALRAFEAAARLQSFVRAADELSVTAGAISQHIKLLEEWAGTALFVRSPNGVLLTDEGKSLAPVLQDAFDSIGAATRILRGFKPKQEIHVATLPALAQLWLPSRLAVIREQLPQAELRVTALETAPNLDREMFDLSLFIGDPTGGEGEFVLAEDVIFPVCSPSLAESLKTDPGYSALTLLIDQTWEQDWTHWSKVSGVSLLDSAGSSRYSLYSLALEEAKAGAGLLMGHACLVEDALAKGDLVRPFPQDCKTGKSLILKAPSTKDVGFDLERLVCLLG